MSAPDAGNQLGIDELGEWCGVQRAAFLDLFETLGRWALAAGPGEYQRRWLTASHRHGWHASLCLDRSPTIPLIDIEELTLAHRGHLKPPAFPTGESDDAGADCEAWYRGELDRLTASVTELAALIDPTIDPSTHRLCTLLLNDLTEPRVTDGARFRP